MSEISKAAWRGVLSIDLPTLGLGNITYHLRAIKTKTDQQPVKFVRVDTRNNRKVVIKEVASQTVPQTQPQSEPQIVYRPAMRKAFYEDDIEGGLPKAGAVEIPLEFVVDKQEDTNGEIIEPFDRTTEIQVREFVPLERVEEYSERESYQFSADTDKKVNESVERVKKLARYLLEKQTALVSFFSWGRGYKFYTAVIYPYERKDGRLWLLLKLSEGRKILESQTNLEEQKDTSPLAVVPEASPKRKKPLVKISV